MAVRLLLCLLLPGALLSDAAKILTVSLVGGSHYLMMDHVSLILQDHGHNVTMVKQEGLSLLSDYKEEKKTYQILKWFLHEDFKKEYSEYFNFFIEESLHGRSTFQSFLKFVEHLATQCSHLLKSSDMIDHLTKEDFDLIVIEVFDFCPLLITEKLEKPFVSILSSTFGVLEFGLPTPVSYVPVFHSYLSDRMDFWDRVKNLLQFFDFQWKQWQIRSTFDNTIREHFPEGSRPVLSHLLGKAELWFINSDFAFDFARPLHPNTVYVGGLMAKPVKPVPKDLESFIAKFGDSGFILVALGSMISTYQTQWVVKEMNDAFACLPQGVIWRYKRSHWPKDVQMAANVKIVDWLPQSDMLAHSRIQLFVSHGGQNSLMEAIQHSVPVLGIPLFGDQPENLIRAQAKGFGVIVPIKQLKAETLALKMKQVIEDKRYKSAAMAANVIRRSHPLSPTQRLVRWIDHILQTGGGAHLKPSTFQQRWYEQYMLDVFLFLLGITLGSVWLCGKLLRTTATWLSGSKKLKQM